MKVIARPFVPKRPARLYSKFKNKHQSDEEIEENNVPNAMQVAVGIRRRIIVYNDIDPLNVDTTAEDISCDQNSLLKRLERGVTFDSIK